MTKMAQNIPKSMHTRTFLPRTNIWFFFLNKGFWRLFSQYETDIYQLQLWVVLILQGTLYLCVIVLEWSQRSMLEIPHGLSTHSCCLPSVSALIGFSALSSIVLVPNSVKFMNSFYSFSCNPLSTHKIYMLFCCLVIYTSTFLRHLAFRNLFVVF